MIQKHLPPLGALRAFEASARHLSVKKAAQVADANIAQTLNEP